MLDVTFRPIPLKVVTVGFLHRLNPDSFVPHTVQFVQLGPRYTSRFPRSEQFARQEAEIHVYSAERPATFVV